jgi:small subunit ribosomal protein S18e
MADFMASPDFQFIIRVLNTNVDGRKSELSARQARLAELLIAARVLLLRRGLVACSEDQGGQFRHWAACFCPRMSPACPGFLTGGFDFADIVYALTAIVGIGRRFAHLLCKKAGVDTNQRAGQLKPEQYEKIVAILSNPQHYKIPEWFLNRRSDFVDGKSFQIFSNNLSTKLREDIERMKKARIHRGIRHYWNLKVRGQHTVSTGRGDVKLMHH